MQTVKNLLHAKNNKKMGNHRVEFRKNKFDHQLRIFYYYVTPICTVNDDRGTFTIDDSYGTVSTKRACNAYRSALRSKYDYTEITL